MLKGYARWVTGHAVIVLLLCAAATLVALAQIVDLRSGALRLQLDTSFEQMLPSGDESRAFYDRKKREGKRHHQAVIALARRRVNVLWAVVESRTPFRADFKLSPCVAH